MIGTDDLLFAVSASTIALGLAGGSALACELGYWSGRRTAARRATDGAPHTRDLQAAMLALLGLLLAFTFGMAAARYDARRLAILEETNAIGTSYLRADLLDRDDTVQLQEELRRYVDVRLEFYGTGFDSRARSEVEKHAAHVRGEMWSRAAAIGRQHPDAVSVGLFVASLNAVIDAAAKQAVVFDSHVPDSILFALFCTSVLSLAAVGYHGGQEQRRHVFLTAMLITVVVLTILLILDLDRPQRGLIRVSADSMVQLKMEMERTQSLP
jgi:hypothetical protein